MFRPLVNGINLAYKDYGAGLPILCLHGGMGIDSAYLDVPALTLLANRRYRVIIFDQRGHGQSDPSNDSDYTHKQWIEDARGLAEHLNLNRFVLLGQSYGGFLALGFALRWPEMLSHLVLIGTSAGPVCLHPPSCNTDDDLRETYRAYWPGFFASPNKHWEIFDRLSFAAKPYRSAFKEELPKFDVRSGVANITLSTLLMVGDQDRYKPDMRWLHQNLVNSSLVVINQAGHMPFIEQPEEFVRAIGEFLPIR